MLVLDGMEVLQTSLYFKSFTSMAKFCNKKSTLFNWYLDEEIIVIQIDGGDVDSCIACCKTPLRNLLI